MKRSTATGKNRKLDVGMAKVAKMLLDNIFYKTPHAHVNIQ